MSYNVWLNRLQEAQPKFPRGTPKSCRLIARIALGAVVFGVTIKVVTKIVEYRKKRQRVLNSLAKPDVVILHQFPRGTNIPNISPFPLKVETYLRLAKITYENDHRDYMGPKGKCPYITLNGEDIADSQLIIEHLNQVFKVDLNKGLTDEEKAIGRALRIMLEDHLYWAVVLHRWVYDENQTIMTLTRWPLYMQLFMFRVLKYQLKSKAWMQGLGRHTKAQVSEMARKDLIAVSKFLGEKPFLFGDHPTEEDCGVFGMLAQCLLTFPGSFIEDLMNGECCNLKDYCMRMKTQVWPDWDKCIKPFKAC